MSPGEKLSSIRKSKGLSQELLAEQSRISLRTIQRIEADSTSPRPSTLKILADTLGIAFDELSFTGAQQVEDTDALTKLRLLNFSSLLGLLIPLSNVLFPLIIWQRNSQHPLVNEKGRKIISFQILWTLTTALLVFIIPALQYMLVQAYVIGRFPPTIFIVYFTLLMLNLLFTLRAAIKLQRGDVNFYSFIPSLF